MKPWACGASSGVKEERWQPRGMPEFVSLVEEGSLVKRLKGAAQEVGGKSGACAASQSFSG